MTWIACLDPGVAIWGAAFVAVVLGVGLLVNWLTNRDWQ